MSAYSTTYINSPKEYIRSLIEEAYDTTIDDLRVNWKEHDNYGPSDLARAKIVMAYELALDYKRVHGIEVHVPSFPTVQPWVGVAHDAANFFYDFFFAYIF